MVNSGLVFQWLRVSSEGHVQFDIFAHEIRMTVLRLRRPFSKTLSIKILIWIFSSALVLYGLFPFPQDYIAAYIRIITYLNV